VVTVAVVVLEHENELPPSRTTLIVYEFTWPEGLPAAVKRYVKFREVSAVVGSTYTGDTSVDVLPFG
jgi:hypothetical protein